MNVFLFVFVLVIFVGELCCSNKEIRAICDKYEKIHEINPHGKLNQEQEQQIKQKLDNNLPKAKFDLLLPRKNLLHELLPGIRLIIANFLETIHVKYLLCTKTEIESKNQEKNFYYDCIFEKNLKKFASKRAKWNLCDGKYEDESIFSNPIRPYPYYQGNQDVSLQLLNALNSHYKAFISIKENVLMYCNSDLFDWIKQEYKEKLCPSVEIYNYGKSLKRGGPFAIIFTRNQTNYKIHKIMNENDFFNYIETNNIEQNTVKRVIIPGYSDNFLENFDQQDKKYVWLFDIIECNNKKMPFLHSLIKYKRNYFLAKMVKKGINLSVVDMSKETALHRCTIDNNVEFAKVLINNGADVNAKDGAGWVALDFIIKNEQEMIDLLLKNGAAIDSIQNTNPNHVAWLKHKQKELTKNNQ